MIATDRNGLTISESYKLDVQNPLQITADVNPNTPQIKKVDSVHGFNFEIELLSKEVTNASYTIDFGDASEIELPKPLGLALIRISHVYRHSGIYTVKVEVSNQVSNQSIDLRVELNSFFENFNCGLFWEEFPGEINKKEYSISSGLGHFLVKKEIDLHFHCTWSNFLGK